MNDTGFPDPDEVVSAYLDGRTTPEQSAWVRAHSADAAVAGALAETAALKSLLGGLATPQASSATWLAIHERVSEQAARDARRLHTGRVLAAAAAVLLILAVGLGVVVVTRPGGPAPTAIEASISRPSTPSAAPATPAVPRGGPRAGTELAQASVLPAVAGPLIKPRTRAFPTRPTSTTRSPSTHPVQVPAP